MNTRNDKNHIKAIKNLKVKAGDILVVTLKNDPRPEQVWYIKEELAAMPFLKGVFTIVTTDNVKIRKSGPKGGKHPVYLNNLEYLEYLSKKKGDK